MFNVLGSAGAPRDGRYMKALTCSWKDTHLNKSLQGAIRGKIPVQPKKGLAEEALLRSKAEG